MNERSRPPLPRPPPSFSRSLAPLAICQTRLEEFNVTDRAAQSDATFGRFRRKCDETHATSRQSLELFSGQASADETLHLIKGRGPYFTRGGSKSEECLGYFWVDTQHDLL